MNKLTKANDTPLHFRDDQLLWACWLYYEEGLTQGEIGKEMGVSRATINSYLAEARAKEIVTISIELDRLRSVSVAKALRDHFGLRDCVVVPSFGGERHIVDRLARAAAIAIPHLIEPADTIAIGWGRTMLSTALATSITNINDIRVIQATGSTASTTDHTPSACAETFSRSIRGKLVPLAAPAIVSSKKIREAIIREPVIASQLSTYAQVKRVIFGIATLGPDSTIHRSGFFDELDLRGASYNEAVGSVLGRLIDADGVALNGPIDDRMIGLTLEELRSKPTRIAIAGGLDKLPAILATLRGRYANVLITDLETGHGLLAAEGQEHQLKRRVSASDVSPLRQRRVVKKFINLAADVVDESLEGAVQEYADFLKPIAGSNRALRSTQPKRDGKVGLVIGGGSGHEPCFLGYVGQGLADAVAIGNIFASPPPGPILSCTEAASTGAGVLHVYGNYSGDILNFDLAADSARKKGIEVRSIITSDDVALAKSDKDNDGRGVAGNVLIFKVVGAACDQMRSLDDCERIAKKANANCFTLGVAFEPSSLPETRKPSFDIGENEIEIGVGIHGEPGVTRTQYQTADRVVDLMVDRIFFKLDGGAGDKIVLLINSLGNTPLIELYIINRRVRQRLQSLGIDVHRSWTGSYCTSLDMSGVSITIMKLDSELTNLIDHPCNTAALRV